MDAICYKILTRAQWKEFRAAGQFAGSSADLADGYIHLSAASQVRDTASRHFAGQRDLVLLAIDARLLGSALRHEPSRGGKLFPHFYGALEIGMISRFWPIGIEPDGRHGFPPEIKLESL